MRVESIVRVRCSGGLVGQRRERDNLGTIRIRPLESQRDVAMEFLLYLALVPALGVVAQWLAWRSGLPSILLLLLFGVALGYFIQPDHYLQQITGGDEFAGAQTLVSAGFPLGRRHHVRGWPVAEAPRIARSG